MKPATLPRTRQLTIIAQDPNVLDENGRILTTRIAVPAEDLAPGPRGHRVHVVDYDTTTNTLYKPQQYDDRPEETGCYEDPYSEAVQNGEIEKLLDEPGFHAQNVYAIVMRVLARFEFALGRRVGWGFAGHQIYAAPHAFADANAFYSERDQALAFGYFVPPSAAAGSRPVFTCLSHDVVAHETTHALLDGLRERYTAPSTPEQAGFHEGFADIVALLSLFSLKDVVATLLRRSDMTGSSGQALNYVPVKSLDREKLESSVLLGMAEQMGAALSGVRGQALRRSVQLPRKTDYLKSSAFEEPHRCGELLVAAMMDAFLSVWLTRLQKHIRDRVQVDVSIVVEEGSAAADHLLTMAIRALDYLQPTDIRFKDYLSALLTADRETVPDDTRYEYRKQLRECFAAYGVKPAADGEGYWDILDEKKSRDLVYDRTHFDSLLRDPNEVFRFIWDNRQTLDLEPKNDNYGKAYMKVQSVRPCMKLGPDGFVVRETVAEYIQMSTLRWDELAPLGITGMKIVLPPATEITLYGGGTLIFDEYGKLKYHVKNSIFSNDNQPRRIEFLTKYGYLGNPSFTTNIFSRMHINRMLASDIDTQEAF